MKTDGNIIGVGRVFEPNAFLSDYENYGLYTTKRGAEEKVVEQLGYDFYKAKDYYLAGKEGKARMTNVYADDEVTGLSIFSITSPIKVQKSGKGEFSSFRIFYIPTVYYADITLHPLTKFV